MFYAPCLSPFHNLHTKLYATVPWREAFSLLLVYNKLFFITVERDLPQVLQDIVPYQ